MIWSFTSLSVVAVLQKEHTVVPLEIVKDNDDFAWSSILFFTEDIEFFEQLGRTVGTLTYHSLIALVRLETHEDACTLAGVDLLGPPLHWGLW